MKLINSLLFALGLVALASRIVATSAAGNPLVVAGRSTAKNGKASIGAVVETNRRLQELQDGKCQKEVTDLTTCVFTNCAEGEECPDHVRFYPTGFLPSPSSAGCDILQKDYCTELTTLGHCCPQCTELTVSYWECFLKDQFLPICQDMSFDCHGTINGGGGDDDDGDESVKASTDLQDLKDASCLDDLSAVFNCYFEKCPSAECHSDCTFHVLCTCVSFADTHPLLASERHFVLLTLSFHSTPLLPCLPRPSFSSDRGGRFW